MPADGVFVYVGLAPNTGFLGDLVRLDAAGRIETDADLRSSHPRIFAAGDIRAGAAGLALHRGGDGAAAARRGGPPALDAGGMRTVSNAPDD